MLFLIEAAIACLGFHLMVAAISQRRQEVFANDYPPAVTDRLRAMGLIAQKPPAKKKDVIRKLIALLVCAVLFALLLRHVNKISAFSQAALTAYGLWLVVDWYDFLVMDVLCAPFDKFYKLSGVSTLNREAVAFHFKRSVRGMVLGIFCALLVGLIVPAL